MYCKKGLIIPTMGTVLIIITIITLMFVGAFSSSMEGGIIQKGGKAISLSNHVEFWKKSIDESSKIIFMRTAYDLGKTGGMDSLEISVWNVTYPSIGFLREELENRIDENLPKSSIGTGKIVKFGEGNIRINLNILNGDANYDGNVDDKDFDKCQPHFGKCYGDSDYNADCDFNYDRCIDISDIVSMALNLGKSGPVLANSKNFHVKGNKSFSIYDKSIDSTAYASNIFNSNASSSYFKLIYVGRKIVEDPIYSSLLNDMTALKNKLKTDFPDLDFELEPSTESVIEVTITDKSCLPGNYCLAPLKRGEAGITVSGRQIPYDYLKLKFKALGSLGGDFGVSVSPSDNIIVQGNTSTPTVNVFGISSTAVTLSVMGCPAGATCTFSDNAKVPPFSSTLTITTTLATLLGTHIMTVTGTNGTTTHSRPYSLTVISVACRCSPGTPDETNCGSCAGATTSKQPSWCDATGNWVSDQCGAVRHDCRCPLGKTCNAATGACCTPTTCAALGKNCGSWPDGCGNTLNCGTCLAGQPCNNGVCCNLKTCADYPGQCGSLSNGCGGTITCGLSCDDNNPCTNDFCSGNTCTNTILPDGTPCDGPGKTCQSGVCTCVPKACSDYPGQCGSLSDGCSGTITCNCPGGENCVSGVCVPPCTPTTCAALGKNCGSWPDGCGGTLNCGTCSAPLTCKNGACVCQCSDGTLCGQCAITDAFKPSWCDNNGNWVANQCNAPHSCQCPGASPICKLDGTCKPTGVGCFCDWNMEYACGISPNTYVECRIAIWWYGWWKKCECEDSVGDPNPGCGQIYGITCGGFPEYTEICRNSLWPVSDTACECNSCPS